MSVEREEREEARGGAAAAAGETGDTRDRALLQQFLVWRRAPAVFLRLARTETGFTEIGTISRVYCENRQMISYNDQAVNAPRHVAKQMEHTDVTERQDITDN